MGAPKRARWSWQLGTIAGISIRAHVTLLVLLAWLVATAPFHGHAWLQALLQVILVIAVFATIVVHELGHALVARRFGCATREILLLPIGGIARMDRIPERPLYELLVAVAGPAVNIVLAAVLGATLAATGASFAMAQATTMGGLVAQLMWVNIGLAVFNLIPAFPMDGGRVFRALLAFRMGRERATAVAAMASKVFAALFVLFGIGGNLMLCLIGVFVWFTAQQEAANVALSKLLARGTVADAMLWSPHSVDVDESVDEVAARIIHNGDRELAVFEEGHPAGIVMSSDVVRRMMSEAPHGSVGSLMHRDVPVVRPTAQLSSVLQPLEESGAALVVDETGLVGLLTLEQVATYAALHGVS